MSEDGFSYEHYIRLIREPLRDDILESYPGLQEKSSASTRKGVCTEITRGTYTKDSRRWNCLGFLKKEHLFMIKESILL